MLPKGVFSGARSTRYQIGTLSTPDPDCVFVAINEVRQGAFFEVWKPMEAGAYWGSKHIGEKCCAKELYAKWRQGAPTQSPEIGQGTGLSGSWRSTSRIRIVRKVDPLVSPPPDGV